MLTLSEALFAQDMHSSYKLSCNPPWHTLGCHLIGIFQICLKNVKKFKYEISKTSHLYDFLMAFVTKKT